MVGLEQFAVGEQVSHPLASFNFARDLLPKVVPGPLLIVASDEAFTALYRSAPDLCSWRQFEIHVNAVGEPVQVADLHPARVEASEDAVAEVERLSALLQGVLTRRTAL